MFRPGQPEWSGRSCSAKCAGRGRSGAWKSSNKFWMKSQGSVLKGYAYLSGFSMNENRIQAQVRAYRVDGDQTARRTLHQKEA